jgi:hypothetical protein
MTGTGIIKVSVISMNTNELIEQLHIIYKLIEDDKICEAESFFTGIKIVDTKKHLSLPKNLRHLIWDLYEFLVLNNTYYTDRKEILSRFESLFKQHTKNETI